MDLTFLGKWLFRVEKEFHLGNKRESDQDCTSQLLGKKRGTRSPSLAGLFFEANHVATTNQERKPKHVLLSSS